MTIKSFAAHSSRVRHRAVGRATNPSRPLVPDAALPPRPLVSDAVYHLHPCRRRSLVPDPALPSASMRAPAPLSFRRTPESRKVSRHVGRIARVTLDGMTHVLSFPPGGNVFYKPLDSGFRRAATGILPSRRIPDFLSINDGKVVCRAFINFGCTSVCRKKPLNKSGIP